METTISFQESDNIKSKAQKGGMYKKEELDSPDDSVKRATPDLPRSRSRTPDLPAKHSKQASFTLPSLDENSKAPSNSSSRRSSLSDSENEYIGALPAHDQLRRSSIASTKTDSESTYRGDDSSKNSPLQSGASSKAQSPVLNSRKDLIENPVEYLQDPFTSLSLDSTASSGPQKDSESVSVSSGSISSDKDRSKYELAPPVFSSELKSKSKFASENAIQEDEAFTGISSGQSKKRTKKKDDSKPSPLEEESSESQIKRDGSSTEATPTSPPKKENHASSPSRQQQQSTGEFDGFQDDYLEDSEYKYKTAICRSHLATGYCEYGPACQYAHGVQELRPRDFDVKFKTELCKNYHAMGMCWFGSRCRFIHDEYRLQAGENEFWLVAPSENLVRVEIVDPENTARKKLLQSLVSLPSQCFPKPWEAQLREDGSPQHPPQSQAPPQLQQLQQLPHHLQHLPPHLLPQQLPPHFQPLPGPPRQQFPQQFPQQSQQSFSLPFPVHSYAVPPNSLPSFTSPLAATTTAPYALAPLTRQTSQPLSHTAPAFVPGVASTTSSQRQDTRPEMGRQMDVEYKFPTSEVQPLMNQMALWHLMDPATRQVQYQASQQQAAPIFLDPKEAFGRRNKAKNADIHGEQDEGDARKEALSILQSRAKSHPSVKTSDSASPRASPIMAPRTTTSSTTPPISQLTSPPTFPQVLSQTTSTSSTRPEKLQEPFSVFEKSTEGSKQPSSPLSYRPSPNFSHSYTSFQQSPTSQTESPRANTESSGRAQWRRGGRVWGKRGAGRQSSRTKTTTSAVHN